MSNDAGARLPGATVQVTSGTNSGATATTDAEGTYRFDALATGSTTLVARANGYTESTRTVTVNGTNTLDFTLAPIPPTTGALTGTVSNDTGSRLPGATVQVTSGAASGQTAIADGSGTYRFDALPLGSTTLVARASGYVDGSGTVTITASGSMLNFTMIPSGPRTQFGAGQWRVNIDIAPGRYYSDPVSGCYWERQSGLGGTFGEIIANDFVGFNSAQNIVDILGSDVAFETDGQCGTWFQTPRHGAQDNIVGGTWLVGTQVSPGTYVSNVASGCYWERLRDFTHRGIDGIIANDFVDFAGQQFVTISASDVGFYTDDQCGTWTRTNATISPRRQSPDEIDRNQQKNRHKSGLPR